MSQLARAIAKQQRDRTSGSAATPSPGVVSVRPLDDSSRAALRLAFVVTCALSVVAGTWLLGLLGVRLGFGPVLGVADLQPDPGGGLSEGVAMLIESPRRIFAAALVQPLLIVGAMAAIAIPAGALAITRPRVPGGPRPTATERTFHWIGAIAAVLFAAATIAWTALPIRTSAVTPLPDALAAYAEWRSSIDLVAGVDIAAFVAVILWTILAVRLSTLPWMRALTIVACLFACTSALVASATTGGALRGLDAPRAVVQRAEPILAGRIEYRTWLIAGRTPAESVVVLASGGTFHRVLVDRVDGIVVRRVSIDQALREAGSTP